MHRATWIILALALFGCGSLERDPLGPDGVVLAFGDSLTYGVGAGTAADSYPSVLAELSGLKVVNSGVSGETTTEGLVRLQKVLADVEPDLLILIEGGNDILRNTKYSDIRSNLAAMIEFSESKGVPVVLLGVPEKKLFSDSAPFFDELAADYQVIYDGELIADLLRSPSLKSDPIHLNSRGYREMAESIYELLVDEGVLD